MSRMCDSLLEAMRPGAVSYAELCRDVPGFSVDSGGVEHVHPEFENVILWSNISEEGSIALRTVQKERLAHWIPTIFLTYLVDGTTLRLPLVRRAQSYKKPHWLPVVWNLGGLPEKYIRGRQR